ncbi:MAG TPA: LacI family DNA-binding transcriptional regulator [Candidatus Limnocylindrales bacterium]|nr:LacI family DNA-binding transcriptional regulator [Candidatus Limnocylindrales bacterium]
MPGATLKSLAAATGYSVTTVSRALAGYTDVNEATRQLILDEARQQGYEPNMQGRLLQGKRSQTIGIVLPATGPHFPDPFFAQFVAGIGEQAAQAGFDLLLSTQDGLDEISAYRRLVAGRRTDGLLLMRTRLDDARIRYLAETGLPFVVFGRTEGVEGYAYVDVDGETGQRDLTEHLLTLGHRRIGYITPPRELTFTRSRLRGFHAAMHGAGVPVDEALIVEAQLTEHSGKQAAQALLALPDPPTAIMAGNDLTAIGIMSAVRERGLRVGDDVAVGGFDDIPASEHLNPPLTTVRQPIFAIGQEVARRLLTLIAGQTPPEMQSLITPMLMIRASTLGARQAD